MTNNKKQFVQPDAVDNIHIFENGKVKSMLGHFWEIKSSEASTLTPSYDNYQLLGELDALSRTPGGRIGKGVITYVTLGDTQVGAKLYGEAANRGISVYQSIASEVIIDGRRTGSIMFSRPSPVYNPEPGRRIQGISRIPYGKAVSLRPPR